MKYFLSCLRMELRRARRDIGGLLLWLGVPFSILFVIQLAFGSIGKAPKIEGLILIADHDDTFVSGLVASAFGQGPLAGVFRTEKVEEDAGRRRIAKGDAVALIIIPAGFGQAIRRDSPCKVVLVTNPSQRILPGIAKEVLVTGAEGIHYLHIVGGPQLRTALATSTTPSDAEVARMSIAANRMISELGKYLDPPILDVEFSRGPKSETSSINLTLIFYPGMLMMTFLFLSRAFAATLWREAETGVLRRLRGTSCPLSAFLLSKISAVAIMAVVVAAVALAIGRFALNAPIANAPLALLWLAGCVSVLYLLMMNVQMLASTPHGGDIVTSLFLWPSAMLGGSFFPLPMMPASLAAASRRTPVGWMVANLTGLLDGTGSTAAVLWGLAAMLLLGALALPFTRWNLNRKFLQG